jgi:hypothetical protein
VEDIIQNTPASIAETQRWRDNNPHMTLNAAIHNAKASKLLQQLNDVRSSNVRSLDDVNQKIEALIDIMSRGIEFKGTY